MTGKSKEQIVHQNSVQFINDVLGNAAARAGYFLWSITLQWMQLGQNKWATKYLRRQLHLLLSNCVHQICKFPYSVCYLCTCECHIYEFILHLGEFSKDIK